MVAGIELDSGDQIPVPLQYMHTFFCSCAINFNKVSRDTEDIPGNKREKQGKLRPREFNFQDGLDPEFGELSSCIGHYYRGRWPGWEVIVVI